MKNVTKIIERLEAMADRLDVIDTKLDNIAYVVLDSLQVPANGALNHMARSEPREEEKDKPLSRTLAFGFTVLNKTSKKYLNKKTYHLWSSQMISMVEEGIRRGYTISEMSELTHGELTKRALSSKIWKLGYRKVDGKLVKIAEEYDQPKKTA